MKKVKVAVFIFLFISIFCISVGAEQTKTTENVANEQYESSVYSEYESGYNASGAQEFENILDEQTKEYIKNAGIDISSYDSIKSADIKDVFASLFSVIIKGYKTPLASVLSVIGVLMIFAAVDGICDYDGIIKDFSPFLCFACAGIMLTPIYEVISSSENVLKSVSGFVSAFIPVFAGILSAGGGVATASAGGLSVITVSGIITSVFSFVILPLVKASLILSMCASVSAFPAAAKLSESVKKVFTTISSVASAVFIGVLSLQTEISATSDRLAFKASKAIIGTSFPLFGSAIAEMLNLTEGSLGMLRTGVGIYGIAAVAFLIIPLAATLLFWRIGLGVCEFVSDIFSLERVGKFFKAAGYGLAILNGALIFCGIVFIFSFAIVMKAGGSIK